jgi:hypothetical protein
MPNGIKYGGRTAGTPNKATAEVRALASAYGLEAIVELAKLAGIAKDDDGNPVAGPPSMTASPASPIWHIAVLPGNLCL